VADETGIATLIETLEERLGYRFKDRRRLERALTHRSFAYENREPGLQDYERLEFLGDAVLGFVVSDRLWRDDREASEGVLTRRKQAVVRKETLAESAGALGLGEALRLGRGEESTGGRTKATLLADTFEAVLGAIYTDGGLRAARAFVRRHLREVILSSGRVDEVEDDYKTRFQEKAQGRTHVTPRYRLVSTSGPAHERRFEVEVLVGETVLGRGRGSSRKQAEQEAAREALDGWDEDEG
jgi:ribonuclease-3